jgi:hypothetical protein
MKMRLMKLVCSAAVVAGLTAGLSGCVSYGNTHALLTPVGVAGYHTFKPANAPQNPREIRIPDQRDPNRIADAKAKEERAADSET